VRQPKLSDLRIHQEAGQTIVMISLEMNAVKIRERFVEHQVDHRARVRAAVDIVAEIDHDVAGP